MRVAAVAFARLCSLLCDSARVLSAVIGALPYGLSWIRSRTASGTSSELLVLKLVVAGGELAGVEQVLGNGSQFGVGVL